ncbi:MAG: sigma-54-dependent Fis family transcriptional regulator, partial [Chlorobi bacterium]|nr:sigma-54-dependent Fis family transcriptional regulator [Chlorobiota bacterium]
KLPGMSGLEIIERSKNYNKLTKYILITGYSEEEAFIKATRIGVDEILKKPYNEYELQQSVSRLLKLKKLQEENIKFRERLQTENQILKEQIEKKFEEDKYLIIGDSASLKNVLMQAATIAKHSVDTLIAGETGTGKELLARYIHRTGKRSRYPFVPVNCAALTPSLFESELFGFEKGAFTNALHSKAGLFEIADKGILFLDEITEIPLELQAKLLRVVEEKKIKRVGGTKEINIDVQILSSTNRDIEKALKNSVLREDIFHRLANSIIYLPPLRERRGDLELLTNHFFNLYSKLFDKKCKPLPVQILRFIEESEWPGNIRQLSHFIKNWCLFENKDSLINGFYQNGCGDFSNGKGFSFKFLKGDFSELQSAKIWLVEKALAKFNGNKAKAAEYLGITVPGLIKMLKKK